MGRIGVPILLVTHCVFLFPVNTSPSFTVYTRFLFTTLSFPACLRLALLIPHGVPYTVFTNTLSGQTLLNQTPPHLLESLDFKYFIYFGFPLGLIKSISIDFTVYWLQVRYSECLTESLADTVCGCDLKIRDEPGADGTQEEEKNNKKRGVVLSCGRAVMSRLWV